MPIASSRPWHPGVFKNAPLLAFTLLGASFIFSGLALYVVHSADGDPVDSWPISPSVYLSILATLSGIALRSAFQEGAETYWWSLLLSSSGVRLRTLHHAWELKHDALSRFKVTRADPEPILRTAGIILLLMAANGPLLQRAVVVDLVSHNVTSTVEVPIRREPMWNLTAKYYRGLNPLAAAYQDEFASVAADLNQRRPMRLLEPVCPLGTICKANITIASFGRACSKSSISLDSDEVPLLPDFQNFTSAGMAHSCEVVGPKVKGFCLWFLVDFQLDAKLTSHEARSTTQSYAPAAPGPNELPWPEPDLFPVTINYTSYFREKSGSGLLTIQRCNFTSAYVSLPIEIAETGIVSLSQLTGTELSIRNRGVESIPSPIDDEPNSQIKMLAGIEQTMQDLYAGYSIYDDTEDSHVIQGLGPRQFINQADITPIKIDHVKGLWLQGFHLSFRDPLESFTDTLHELSLRYALTRIISTGERLEELDRFFNIMEYKDRNPADRRERALKAMATTPAGRQQVVMRQTSMIPLYQTNSLFAFIAVGISTIVSVLVACLLTGWRRCGRPFSMSPLEIAKAFDAPLLRQVGSNMPASQIAKDDDGARVSYGEVKKQRRSSIADSDAEPSLDADCENAPRAEDGLMEPTGARLTIDVADRVILPVKGKVYV